MNLVRINLIPPSLITDFPNPTQNQNQNQNQNHRRRLYFTCTLLPTIQASSLLLSFSNPLTAGIMRLGMGMLFFLALVVTWFSVDARTFVVSDVSVMQINAKGSNSEIKASETDLRNEVCTLCEQFTAQAVEYLGENKTQKEIIDTLHLACSRMHSFKRECITLVDYYAPLFFSEIATIEPVNFCTKVNLCDEMVLTAKKKMALTSPKSCSLCEEAVAEILAKLDDPDTQLEVIEVLLKVCQVTKGYEKKCKKLVMAYGPLIMDNAEKILEKGNICTTIHACKASPHEIEASKFSLLSES